MNKLIAFILIVSVCVVNAAPPFKIVGTTLDNVLEPNSDGSINVVSSGSTGTQSVAVATQPTVAQIPFYQAVSMGLVDGYSKVNKFGHNPATTDGDTVWGGGGVYGYFPTNALSVVAVSTDVDDADGDTGARTIQVYGLDENWEEATETVTLNGTTPVALTNTYIRLFRTIILTAGSSYSNEGNITVTEVGGSTRVGIFVGAGDGQTQHCIYTVPAGKTAYFIKGYVGVADDDKNGEVAEFQWQARPNNGHTGAWAVKGEIGLNNVGSGHWQYEYGVPSGPIPEKTDIRIVVIDVTATIGVVGGFDMLLVDD
ncbi:MAG: hypothetical protein GY833_23995 [Aestuariibacter sp.]|nr:hypothetical protein [Aestuariibacter sp.]